MFKIRILDLWIIMGLCCLVVFSCSKSPRLPRHQKAAINDLAEGNVWYMRGCYDKAADYYEKALERFSAHDDQEGVAKSLNNLGTLYRSRKDLDSALKCFIEAEGLFKTLDLSLDRIQALSNTAAVHMDMEQFVWAASALDQADALAKEKNLVHPPLLSNRAVWLIRQNKTEDAETLLTRALSLSSPSKAFEYATITHAMGLLMETKKEYGQALTWYTQALDTDRRAYFIRGIATDLTALGRVHLALGDHETAADILYRGLKIQTLLGSADEAETVSSLLKTCLEALGDKAPSRPVTDYYLKQWADGHIISGPCQ